MPKQPLHNMEGLTTRYPPDVLIKIRWTSAKLDRFGVKLSPAQLVRAILTHHFHPDTQRRLKEHITARGITLQELYKEWSECGQTRPSYSGSSPDFPDLDSLRSNIEMERVDTMPREFHGVDYIGDSVPRFPETSLFDEPEELEDDEDLDEDEEDYGDDEDWDDEDEEESYDEDEDEE